MSAPTGWHQPPPPTWGHPKKKSNAPLIAALLTGMLGVLGAGTVGWFYFQAHKDHGTPFSNATLPANCGSINQDTLKQMRVTNPNGAVSMHVESPESSSTTCNWGQTAGQDGEGRRSLNVAIRRYADERLAEEEFAGFARSGNTVEQTDRGALAVGKGGSTFTTVSYAVRSGGQYVRIDYSGWDAGFLSARQPDVEQWKKFVTQIAGEVLAKS